jgi:hypothetical protein
LNRCTLTTVSGRSTAAILSQSFRAHIIMSNKIRTAIILCILAAAVDAIKDPEPARPASQAEAVAAIKKLGGTVILDKTSGEVVEVLLMGTQITDAGLEQLKGLTSLTTLFLTHTQITDAGLEHLQGMTSLTRLYLSNTQITDAGLVHLKGMTSLTWLDLRGTQITDAGLEHLKGLTNLTTLCLDFTQITDAGLEYLKGMTNLIVLSLTGTQITDAGLAENKAALPKWGIIR